MISSRWRGSDGPSDPLEPTELAALVVQIIEEFEDIGAPVTLTASERLVMPLRATWLRRALRNLISNALRYGRAARVSLQREGTAAVIRIEDDGPGIPAAEMDRMLEPFTRGDPSRNSSTGGAGLGTDAGPRNRTAAWRAAGTGQPPRCQRTNSHAAPAVRA